uniref:NADH dehydrogenase [ubiquinone] 1 beta subcomplex subunit 5, mitochondrial n=1 Tax=Equus caballus TaxID=9796 RepID=A0A9L0S0J7_HORSE
MSTAMSLLRWALVTAVASVSGRLGTCLGFGGFLTCGFPKTVTPLTEIPEGYILDHCEYFKHPISRSLLNYFDGPQMNYEKTLAILQIEAEKAELWLKELEVPKIHVLIDHFHKQLLTANSLFLQIQSIFFLGENKLIFCILKT